MTISRFAQRHPIPTAYVAHRFVMAKYHPELNAARKARKAKTRQPASTSYSSCA